MPEPKQVSGHRLLQREHDGNAAAGALKRAEDFKPDTVRQATMKLYRGLLTS